MQKGDGVDLNVALQPLISLATVDIFGYEALARPSGLALAPPALFESAVAGGWIAELELALAARSFDAAARVLEGEQRLFLNVHPAALESRGFARRLLRHRFDMARVVVEITEQGPITNSQVALANVGALRNAGAQFALDDFGSGYAHLQCLEAIGPRFVKISQSIGTGFESAAWRRSVVENVQSFARAVGCAVILEGVETAATAEAARDLGIDIGQGYYFGRPELAHSALLSSSTFAPLAFIQTTSSSCLARMASPSGVLPLSLLELSSAP